MSSVIARIRRADGSVQFDASAAAYQLVAKGAAPVGQRYGGNTTPGTALVPITGLGDTRLIAVSSTFGAARSGVVQLSGQWYATYGCAVGPGAGTLNYWIFELATKLVASPVGLTLRNPAGQVTYSSDYDVMRLAEIFSGTPLSLDASRTYATVAPSFAGHRRAPAGAVYYINGKATLWDGSDYPASTSWAYDNDGKLYGMSVNGGAIASATISYDDVRSQLGFGSTPPPYPPDWTKPLGNVLVLDVTGL